MEYNSLLYRDKTSGAGSVRKRFKNVISEFGISSLQCKFFSISLPPDNGVAPASFARCSAIITSESSHTGSHAKGACTFLAHSNLMLAPARVFFLLLFSLFVYLFIFILFFILFFLQLDCRYFIFFTVEKSIKQWR